MRSRVCEERGMEGVANGDEDEDEVEGGEGWRRWTRRVWWGGGGSRVVMGLEETTILEGFAKLPPV